MNYPRTSDVDARVPPKGGRLERYLARLPEGLASFPEVQARGNLCRMLLELADSYSPKASGPLVDWGRQQHPDAWVSQVKLFALTLAIADAAELDAKGLEGLFFALASRISEGGEPRALMRLLTPAIILRTGAERWERFHRNMPLEAERTPSGVWLSVGRAEVFSPELAIATVGTFRALVAFSLLPEGKVAYAGVSGGRIHYQVTWT